MRKYAITLGFTGKLFESLIKAGNILSKEMNINYIFSEHAKLHIAIIAGETNKLELISKAIKRIKYKKFKLKTLGFGVFANKKPLFRYDLCFMMSQKIYSYNIGMICFIM